MKLDTPNCRGRIEYPVAGQDGTYGSSAPTWALLGVRWMHLQDVLPSRAEKVTEGLEVSQNQTRCRMNYCTDVTSGMRIIVNRPTPTTYQIISGPAILGDKQGIECMLEKVSTVG
jgi:head-tail adaptor